MAVFKLGTYNKSQNVCQYLHWESSSPSVKGYAAANVWAPQKIEIMKL